MDLSRRAKWLAVSSSVVTTVVLPLGIAYLLVSYLMDPKNIDMSELRANSTLMNARPAFRNIFDPDILIVSLASSGLLLVVSMVGAFALAVPAGIAHGWSNRRRVKALAWTASTIGAALPTFFWAVALSLFTILLWRVWGIETLPFAGFGIDEHLILPAVALGIRPASYIFRLTATAVDEIAHADYVRTALAKGLPSSVLLARHVLPNAAPNIISATVLATRGALSGLVFIDYFYIWGGAGLLFVQALALRRFELATQLVIAFALVSVLLALAADIARSRVQVDK